MDFVEKWTKAVSLPGHGLDVKTRPRRADIESQSNCFDFQRMHGLLWYMGMYHYGVSLM